MRLTLRCIPALASILVAAFAAACAEASPPASANAGTTGAAGIAPPQLDPSQARPPQAVSQQEVERLGYTWGDVSAPIQVYEFSDFGCGYCRKFHEETFPALLEEYVEAGHIFWRFIPFNVGMFPNAEGALKTGECAGEQGQILAASDELFARQGDWKRGDADAAFEASARAAGLDMQRWSSCMEEGRGMDRTAANTDVARRVGIRGTPTFFVDGYPIPGALPLDNFRTIFDGLLEERAQAPAAGAAPGSP